MRPNEVPPENPPVPAKDATPATAAAISQQWQTKDEYSATQVQTAQAQTVSLQQPVAGQPVVSGQPVEQGQLAPIVPNQSKFTLYASIALGVSVLLFILAVTTELGQIGKFTDASISRANTAYPVMAVTAVLVILSFFATTISGIVTSHGRPGKKALSIIFLTVGTVLMANPIGLFVVWMLVYCNFQSCSGS